MVAEKKKKKFAGRDVAAVFWRHLSRYPFLTFSTLFFTVALCTSSIVAPIYYKHLLDLIGTGSPTVVPALFATLFAIFVVYAINWCFRRAAYFSNIYLASRVMNDLSQTAFSSILEHSYSFFANNFSGGLVRKVNRLSRAYEDFTDQILYNFLPLIVTLGGILIVLSLRSGTLGAVFSLWVVVMMIFQILVAGLKMNYNLEVAAKDSETTAVLADAIGNDTTIKLFTGETHERSLYAAVSNALLGLRLRSWNYDEVVNGIQGILTIAIEIGLMYTAIRLWANGVITIGDFALIQAYLITAIDQIWNFGRTVRRMYESLADATEMVDIMNMGREITDAVGARSLSVADGVIDFKEVTFNFNENRSVLVDFDLRIAAKEKVALVGPSGAGKSTITRLILRLYDVTGGAIEVDGQNIAEVTQDSLRAAIAFVPQEPILFHRTLMENIRYGRRDATDEEVIEAAKQAHCYDFIMQTPEKFGTFVGERGIKLSGGERQRVAIARAILKNAPILILDEATSSLDSESEMLIQDALGRLMEGKTVIAIAHRLSTVMKMDRIIVIEDGKVAMTGTHSELLTHGGLYKKLWEIQAGGFIENDTDESVPSDEEE